MHAQTLGRLEAEPVSNQPSDIDRGLFGYRRSSVNQAISDRDIMIRQSENRARDAEARAAELEERMSALQREVSEQQTRLGEREEQLSQQMGALNERLQELGEELASRDNDVAERDRHIQELRAHVDRLVKEQMEAPRRPDEPAQTMLVSEEVGRLLRAAEESAARIVEQARETSARNVAESERQWRELQASLARYAGWRDRVDPQLADLHARMEELRSRIGEIPDRVRAAFAPLAEASAATEAGLQAMGDDLTPPLLSAPSASESAPAVEAPEQAGSADPPDGGDAAGTGAQ
jgi:chromosome segregation ATPase